MRPSAGLMLGHRLQRCTSIKPAMGERLVLFSGMCSSGTWWIYNAGRDLDLYLLRPHTPGAAHSANSDVGNCGVERGTLGM